MTLSPRRSVIATVLLALTAILGTSSPASAAEPRPSFQVFYGPGCATAYRTHLGPRTPGVIHKEYWIHDTFNASSASSPGYGQKIRQNAASIRLQPRTRVKILDGYGQWSSSISNSSYSTSRCLNFVGLRNDNVAFRVAAYLTVF
ncbi:hypothetical protein [Streptomyces olivaceus]|uniref:hypothetical protein n=1 Tax=Streptomyces olivaceus TaxID=47716 RepID=UPI0022EF3AB1|nr:hypothetical protein [Streptomyces olivaceus]GHI95424.1 hypothetical protein TPA0905_48950 [Streptomyces olivaceus]